MSKVAIIGSGLIGRSWAVSFARAGHEVFLWDGDASVPPKALAHIDQLLPALAAYDLIGAPAATVRTRMHAVTELRDALDGADHVQESTSEDLAIKREVFARLDLHAMKDAVIASSTSSIPPSAFSGHLPGRSRCLVVHPINPPYLVPAVEVVPAPWTAACVVERTAALLRGAGHAPIVMKREIDGFVMNRLQGALLEEAFRLVAEGYADAEDIDIGIREGLSLRWSFMGPFETIDLNAPGGVRDYAARYQAMYKRMFADVTGPIDWEGPVMDAIERDRRRQTSIDRLGERQLWRDRRLMALAAHKRHTDEDIGP